MRKRILTLLAVAALVTAWAVPASAADATTSTFTVTITNLTPSQPISPPVVATHHANFSLFDTGAPASDGLTAIAEDGNPDVAFEALDGAAHVTDVVNVGRPLTRSGTTVGDFSDTVTIEIEGDKSDVLSFAGMLICTNDGFTGLDGVDLPRRGTATFHTVGYDAGTEINTEASEDIVDPCSGLGPIGLDGDPNGNNNDGIDEGGVITHHPGIAGTADLSAEHEWDAPILMVSITRG